MLVASNFEKSPCGSLDGYCKFAIKTFLARVTEKTQSVIRYI